MEGGMQEEGRKKKTQKKKDEKKREREEKDERRKREREREKERKSRTIFVSSRFLATLSPLGMNIWATAYLPGSGSCKRISSSAIRWKKLWGIAKRMPAPSPLIGSHPQPPRCSIRVSISFASIFYRRVTFFTYKSFRHTRNEEKERERERERKRKRERERERGQMKRRREIRLCKWMNK